MQDSASLPLGIIFNKGHQNHCSTSLHPESPDRLDSIMKHLNESELLQKCILIDEYPSSSNVMALAHDLKYIELTKSLEPGHGDTYVAEDTQKIAESAASGACLAVDKVFKNEFGHAFCLIRPPGHHANTRDDCLTGFCVYNNIAIAALHAKQQYNVKKILIFDWDVHHGDSTQKIFEKDPSVLFISIHKYQQGGFFPGCSGSIMNIGKDEGKGFNINCPWDITEEAGCCRTVGDNEYVYLLEAVLMPIILSFQPELVFVSAGFDSANGDPLGGLSVSPYCYSYILHRLLSLGKRVILALEGGYNPAVNALSVEYCVRALLNEPLPLKNGPEKWDIKYMKEKCIPNKIAFDLVEKLVRLHSQYWPILKDQEYNSLRDQIKQSTNKFLSQDMLLCSHPSSIISHNNLFKEFKLDECFLLKRTKRNQSYVGKGLDIIEEYLPKFIKNTLRDGMNLITYDLGLKSFTESSYFVMKFGCDNLEGPQELYINKKARMIKLVVRDDENKIVEKWDEGFNYGVNYDMKINDWNHDKFILFLRYFLESHNLVRPNYSAFYYFRDFIEKLESWISQKTRVTFSSLTFGFVLNNLRNEYKACLLDFEEVQIFKEESEDHNLVIKELIQEMKKVLRDDEYFVINL